MTASTRCCSTTLPPAPILPSFSQNVCAAACTASRTPRECTRVSCHSMPSAVGCMCPARLLNPRARGVRSVALDIRRGAARPALLAALACSLLRAAARMCPQRPRAHSLRLPVCDCLAAESVLMTGLALKANDASLTLGVTTLDGNVRRGLGSGVAVRQAAAVPSLGALLRRWPQRQPASAGAARGAASPCPW